MECESRRVCGGVYEEWRGGREGEVLGRGVDDCALCVGVDGGEGGGGFGVGVETCRRGFAGFSRLMMGLGEKAVRVEGEKLIS